MRSKRGRSEMTAVTLPGPLHGQRQPSPPFTPTMAVMVHVLLSKGLSCPLLHVSPPQIYEMGVLFSFDR